MSGENIPVAALHSLPGHPDPSQAVRSRISEDIVSRLSRQIDNRAKLDRALLRQRALSRLLSGSEGSRLLPVARDSHGPAAQIPAAFNQFRPDNPHATISESGGGRLIDVAAGVDRNDGGGNFIRVVVCREGLRFAVKADGCDDRAAFGIETKGGKILLGLRGIEGCGDRMQPPGRDGALCAIPLSGAEGERESRGKHDERKSKAGGAIGSNSHAGFISCLADSSNPALLKE